MKIGPISHRYGTFMYSTIFQKKDDIISFKNVLDRNGYYRSFDKDRKFTKYSAPGLMALPFSISVPKLYIYFDVNNIY